MAAQLTGRTALITGATGGLGQAIAHGLADAGCALLLSGPEPSPPAHTTLPIGPDIAYHPADLRHAAGAEGLMQAALSRFGTIDIVVNNAVLRHFAPIERFTPADWEAALSVNLSAAFHTIRLAVPGMRARRWGRIVNIASVYGIRGATERVDYVTTKTGLIGLTRAVALETVADGITCNALCPGSIETPAIATRVAALAAAEGLDAAAAARRFLLGKQPSGRFIGAGAVVAMLLFLCSDAAAEVTGAALPVDGGWTAG